MQGKRCYRVASRNQGESVGNAGHRHESSRGDQRCACFRSVFSRTAQQDSMLAGQLLVRQRCLMRDDGLTIASDRTRPFSPRNQIRTALRCHRRVDDTQDGTPPIEERDGDGTAFQAAQKIPGAVLRVDHPAGPSLFLGSICGAGHYAQFFADKPCWPGRKEFCAQLALDLNVDRGCLCAASRTSATGALGDEEGARIGGCGNRNLQ